MDYNDFVATTGRIDTWDQWLPEWAATADSHALIAQQASAEGHLTTAGHAWRRASVCRHFGKFVWAVDPEMANEATLRSVTETRNALSLLDPTASRIETRFDNGIIAANLRLPKEVDNPPLVVVLPGLDSTKEEFFFLEQSFLERGMATVSIDGAGQGETALSIPLSAHYHQYISAVLDELLAEPADRFDPDRLGLCGVSLGGFYAPHVTAHESRVKAVLAISGPFNFGEVLPTMPEISIETFMNRARLSDREAAFALAGELNLEGLCKQIAVPTLYVTGDADRITPWRQTERQAAETPGAQFINYPGGTHTVSNLPRIARPMMADWMADQLMPL